MTEPQSVWELVEWRAGQTPDALMAVDEHGRTMTFFDFRLQAERAAAGLGAMGVGDGVNVSWQLPTWLESMVLVAALARLGAVQNPMLPIYRRREVAFAARETGARLLVVPAMWRGFDYAALAADVATELTGLDVIVLGSSGLPDADPSTLPKEPDPRDRDAGAVRWIYYTSGTTGDPKGVQHSDATVIAAGRSLATGLHVVAEDREALVFPFAHIGGAVWLVAGLLTGCEHVVVEAWDPATTIDVLARQNVTLAGSGTPFHLAYLARQVQQPGRALFPHVRAFPGGASPKPPQLHYELKRALGGVGILSAYGLTEAPILTVNGPGDPDEKLANTEGRPGAGVSFKVTGPGGAEVRAGEEGELRVRAPQCFLGYVDDAFNADAFDADGWLRTGDLGHIDADGFVTITGRLKDVIIRKGENISAKEVEDLLYRHPRVADVAVIGLPDTALGERCCAVVVAADPTTPLGFSEMVAHLKAQELMTQKIPEQLEHVDVLPRNITGKVLKGELRARFTQGSPELIARDF